MRWRSLAAAALSTMLAGGALAAPQTGTAVGVDPDASARGNGGARTLAVGSDVAVGETVVTDANGQVQILFEDETRLVVGPSSSLLIEKYLLRGNENTDRFAINALSGSFRFITGRSPKAAYEIKTPSATIGVRGTAFDFTVDALNLTTLVLFHGSVLLCTPGGQCVVLDSQCQVGAVDMVQSVRIRPNSRLRAQFPLIGSQEGLLADFRVAQADRCLRPSTGGTPDSLSHTGGGDSTPQPQPQTQTQGNAGGSITPTTVPTTNPATGNLTNVP